MDTMTDRKPSDGLPADAPASVRDVADGRKTEDERGALDWFLGSTRRLEYDVPVQFDTPEGMKTLIFHLRQVDGDRLQALEDENRQGDGPFAKLDVMGFNAAIVCEATAFVTDASGRQVELSSQEFTGGVPSPVLALQTRFKTQPGILDGLAERIRAKAAFGGDRVGSAQRSLVEVGKP